MENNLKIASAKLFKYFRENWIKQSKKKSRFLPNIYITKKYSLSTYLVGNSSSEKVLEIIIDKNVNLNEHVTNLCNKSSKKQLIARTFPYMPVTQRKNFHEYPLFVSICKLPVYLMKHSKTLNNRINELHKRKLRVA